jgi:hypothetical protein
MTPEDRELFEKLDAAQQQRVLEFVRSLSEPQGVPGSSLLRFAGMIPLDDLEKMAQAIEEDCERIDPSEW